MSRYGMGIYILFGVLLSILVLNVSVNNKCFGAPAVVFTFAFLLASIWACVFAEEWELNLHYNTFMVISFSVSLFSIICLFTRWVDGLYQIDHSYKKSKNNTIIINDKKIKAFIVFEIIVIIYYLKILKNTTGEQNLSHVIHAAYVSGNSINIPFVIRQAITLMTAGGYWFSFIVANNYMVNKKIPWIQIIPILLSAICVSLNGTRGTAACMLLSIVAFLILIDYRNNKHNRKIEIKKIILVVLVFGGALWCFPKIGGLLGRISYINSVDYVAAYIGAEIKNLDLFLENTKVPVNSGTWGSLVFQSLEGTLSKYFGFVIKKPSSLPGFNVINGHFLGNVYTIFFDLLYDFGYFGNFTIIIILAFINQRIFDLAEKKIVKRSIPIVIIFYGYMFPLIFVSFFAWWFGNYVISTGFIYKIIYWNLLNIFFFKIKPLPKFRKLL